MLGSRLFSIDGVWRPLNTEDGYLTINFGYPLEKLLPGVKASVHRVCTQTKGLRVATAAFIDPRVGSYRSSVPTQFQGHEVMVYDWDAAARQLRNPVAATDFFSALSEALFGKDQTKS